MAYSEKNKNNQFGLDDNFFFNARLTETNGPFDCVFHHLFTEVITFILFIIICS